MSAASSASARRRSRSACDKLAFMTDKDGKKYLYTNFTKEQLDAQPAYDKGSYAEKRDEQRLIVQ